jgi:TolB-like protein/tetratricopeptide (TPR) repeat protein
VLPFANLSGDADNEYFSDGLTEEIIARLSSLEGLKVISRTSTMHYKETQKLLRDIARELNVAHVLEGSVRHVDGRVRITAQLIDAASDNHIWADSYELELHNSFRVQEQIAHAVAKALEVKFGKQAAGQIARRGTDDPEAYEMYHRGRWLWTQRTPEALQQAIRYFDSALARDSNYADAYSGLADAYLVSYQLAFGVSEDSAYSRHKWAAERALALDEASADAHTSAANSLWWQGNWPGAERELQRALELNPGNASARGWYALLLFGMGRLEEAREQARRAYETDPFAIIVSITYAHSNYLLRDYDAAIDQYEKTLELNPDWVAAMRQVAVAYSHRDRHEQAIEFTARALKLAPNSSKALADMAYVHARAGRTAEAREFLQRGKVNVTDPFDIGRAYVALGESDSAFVWLERSHWKWVHRGTLADPALDPLRADPRFEELKARAERAVGLR